MNSELALNEIKEILEKYNVSLFGVINPIDYFAIKKAFYEQGQSQVLISNVVIKENDNN